MFLPFSFFQSKNQKPYVDPVVVGALNSGAEIYSLVQIGNILFLGGYFTSIGGVSRNGIAAIDANTGTLLSHFQSGGLGGTNPVISSMVYTGNMLIVGGGFNSINGVSRNGIAAIDPDTGNVLSWYPQGGLTGSLYSIMTMLLKGNILYVAGSFLTIGGVSRVRIAAIDISTAGVTSWYPFGGVSGGLSSKFCLSEDGNTIYLGGSFSMIGGQNKPKISALDPISGSVKTSFNPPTVNSSYTPNIDSIYQVGNNLVIGSATSSFTAISGQTRSGFAILDSTNGSLTSLYPTGGFSGISPYTTGFTSIGNSLYVFGHFDSVGGQTRNGIVSLDLNSMQILSWYPPNGVGGSDFSILRAFPSDSNSIWVYGWFTSIGGVPRNGIAKLNLF
ncbi:PQQ-like beta-propeller repeat protein [Leptospira sanjuanensis]|uniref:PQQ-like beta-propeller repeat protein n=1 Tax=Leptospira sanjuanensis TaxID=2879643 RepID=UPI001EE9607E|nr:PQQ-like beta-propeller repeat protein [Leptospira sanjuanensis]MCG6170220.1 PQQ-like beta-propeller repeat protein [Leptospira sanjuanensis]